MWPVRAVGGGGDGWRAGGWPTTYLAGRPEWLPQSQILCVLLRPTLLVTSPYILTTNQCCHFQLGSLVGGTGKNIPVRSPIGPVLVQNDLTPAHPLSRAIPLYPL